MKDIIHAASSKRFKVGDDDPKKQGIAITDGWFELLNKHPTTRVSGMLLTL